MTLRNALYILRRWRSLVAAGVLIGAVVGWLSAPGTAARTTTFQATHTLLLAPEARRTSLLNQAARLARLGAVPDRVAARLDIDGQLVRSMVSVDMPTNKGLLLITGRSTNPRQAEALANFTVEELLVELGDSKSLLRTLEPAVASPAEAGDFQGPSSRSGRAVLLGAFGLLLGLGSALGVDRLDNRVRSKIAAEDALGVPVVAEVPPVPRSDRPEIVTMAQPSPFIEAYRGLRTSVDRWSSSNGDDYRVIVVISPTGGEGTTITVAHLAATLGEIGRSVLAISADLRRPRLHLYFNKAREPGLTDVLRGAPDARRLLDLNLATTTRGVRFVASGAPVRNPAPLLDHIGDHLRDARALADFVLLDSPPLLTTSDGADLARHADAVLLVVRVGRTSVGAAARSLELLQRLEIPVIGAVLVASDRLRGR